jgi:hypothetical protein
MIRDVMFRPFLLLLLGNQFRTIVERKYMKDIEEVLLFPGKGKEISAIRWNLGFVDGSLIPVCRA